MTNYEHLNSQNELEDVARFLCDSMDYIERDNKYGCDICPVRELCSVGYSGWREWLEREEE